MSDSYFVATGCALLGPRLGMGLILLDVFGFPFSLIQAPEKYQVLKKAKICQPPTQWLEISYLNVEHGILDAGMNSFLALLGYTTTTFTGHTSATPTGSVAGESGGRVSEESQETVHPSIKDTMFPKRPRNTKFSKKPRYANHPPNGWRYLT
jgi:hypothetical protein